MPLIRFTEGRKGGRTRKKFSLFSVIAHFLLLLNSSFTGGGGPGRNLNLQVDVKCYLLGKGLVFQDFSQFLFFPFNHMALGKVADLTLISSIVTDV